MNFVVRLMVLTGSALFAVGAQAQGLAPYPRSVGVAIASDFDGPYADVGPRPLPPPGYAAPGYIERGFAGPGYAGPGYALPMLPPFEVMRIARRNGYQPLGTPQQRGLVYTIAAFNIDGDDGRLVIDARSGRILRFMPAYRMGDRMNGDLNVAYGQPGALPPVDPRGVAQPPLLAPKLASRTALPKAAPRAPAAQPAPVAAASRPADAQASIRPAPAATPVPASPPPVIEAKPSTPAVQPTQAMPAAQGLE